MCYSDFSNSLFLDFPGSDQFIRVWVHAADFEDIQQEIRVLSEFHRFAGRQVVKGAGMQVHFQFIPGFGKLIDAFQFHDGKTNRNGIPEEITVEGFRDNAGYTALFDGQIGLEMVVAAAHIGAGNHNIALLYFFSKIRVNISHAPVADIFQFD
jgi:hypothetical protein